MGKYLRIEEMLSSIHNMDGDSYTIMEVCGSHTEAIKKYGIGELVKPQIRLLSGPGCPVCVTSEDYIDKAIELTKVKDIIITTFGDMLRVKGRKENLLEQKEKGRDIRVLYTPIDAIDLARAHMNKEIIFLAVGFETTAPIIALAIKKARQEKLHNLSFYIGLKRMKPILRYIFNDSDHGIKGLICPGHVASVVGEHYFEFISKEYGISGVIAGFESKDVVQALYYLSLNKEKSGYFNNLYRQCVSYQGNQKAIELMEEVFDDCDAKLRGIGIIEGAGFHIQKEYVEYDASVRYQLEEHNVNKMTDKEINKCQDIKRNKCVCSDILLGKSEPKDCPLYGGKCTPEHPVGPCMISGEGSCAISYKYLV
ncbi:hydrogenase formation protein HypD [Anaeromicropila herbilytica]|uniref:Hydrogenase formation protein HypD n=1 Tax=Anaeromicropila herbilytica TaxID=2785025 RepID=A0A7R7EM27_9FIRM|nr:hydrogenase formation protein HypD [Anaeromicropila herbilytica]BCN31243.1 hydrogenase formation protein HypD [Anaeromicropila herbilytica]